MNGVGNVTLNARSIEMMNDLLKNVTEKNMDFMNKMVKYGTEQKVQAMQNNMKEFGIGTILDMYG